MSQESENLEGSKRKHDYAEKLLPFKKRGRFLCLVYVNNVNHHDPEEEINSGAAENHDDRRLVSSTSNPIDIDAADQELPSQIIIPVVSTTTHDNTAVAASVSLLEMRNSGGKFPLAMSAGTHAQVDVDGKDGAPNTSDGKEAADETKDFVEEHEDGGGGKSSPGSRDQPLGDSDSNNGAPSYDDGKQDDLVGDDSTNDGPYGAICDHHIKQSDKMEIKNEEGGGDGGGSEPQGGGGDHKDGFADDGKLADGIKIDYEGGRDSGSYTATIYSRNNNVGIDEGDNCEEQQGEQADPVTNLEGSSNHSIVDTTIVSKNDGNTSEGGSHEQGQVVELVDAGVENNTTSDLGGEKEIYEGKKSVDDVVSPMIHDGGKMETEGWHDLNARDIFDAGKIVHVEADPVTNLEGISSTVSPADDTTIEHKNDGNSDDDCYEHEKVQCLAMEDADVDEKTGNSEPGREEETGEGKIVLMDDVVFTKVCDGGSAGSERAPDQGGYDFRDNINDVVGGDQQDHEAETITKLEGGSTHSPTDTTVEFKYGEKSDIGSHEEGEVAAIKEGDSYENTRKSEAGGEVEIVEDHKAVDDVSAMLHDAADNKHGKEVHEADLVTKHEGSSTDHSPNDDSLGDDTGPFSDTNEQKDYRRPRPTRTHRRPNWMRNYIN